MLPRMFVGRPRAMLFSFNGMQSDGGRRENPRHMPGPVRSLAPSCRDAAEQWEPDEERVTSVSAREVGDDTPLRLAVAAVLAYGQRHKGHS